VFLFSIVLSAYHAVNGWLNFSLIPIHAETAREQIWRPTLSSFLTQQHRSSGAPMPPSAMLTLKLTRKAQLTQRGTRNSCVCLKAHCEQNLSSRISAIDIGHNNFHPFTRIRQVAIPDSHRGVIKGEGLKGLRTPPRIYDFSFFQCK